MKHTIEELIDDVGYESLYYKDEIITILDGQVAKEPIEYIGRERFACRICDETVLKHENYCSKCGRPLDWGMAAY
jgi:hypothetical protein